MFSQKVDAVKRMCGDMSWAKPAVTIGEGPLHRKDGSPKMKHPCQHANASRTSKTHKELDKETPKSHSRKRPVESENDKENVPASGGSIHCPEQHKPPAKRLALGRDTTKPKGKKKGSARAKKNKPCALPQGQKQLTLFFR